MADTLKEKVERRLAELDRNPFEAARAVELERGFINDILQGKKSSVRGANLAKLAQALDWEPSDLVDEKPKVRRGAPLTGSEVDLPIRFEVAAGAWQAIDEVSDEPLGYAPAPRIAGYEAFPQWYERVVGDSFNRKIPEGALVHVVDAIAMGYAPRQDDIVVVLRRRAGGSFLERTLKQVELTGGGIELWPRSYNDKWSKPIEITRGLRDGEDAEIEIVGRVLRAFIGFDRNG